MAPLTLRASSPAGLSELEEHLLNVADVVSGRRRSLRVLETPRESGGDKQEPDLFESFVSGGDLGDDLAAVSFIDQHLLDTTDLALDPAKSPLQVGRGIRFELEAGRCSSRLGHSSHTTGDTPRGRTKVSIGNRGNALRSKEHRSLFRGAQ